MTTTTNQGVRCGNHGRDRVYHADRNAVRACFAGQRTAQPAAPSQAYDGRIENVNWAAPVAPRNADEARSEGMRRLAAQTSPWFPRAEKAVVEYPASQGRINLLNDLIAEHLVREEDKGMAEAIVAQIEAGMSNKTASALIDAILKLKAQRKAEAVPARTAQPLRASLITEVMGDRKENNFAIIDEDGKARFYRISKRGNQSRRPGTWKIQERVTDMLLPRADSMLVRVAQAIIDQGGPEAAGLRFAQLMHRCYKCGASLTDTTGNPYYSVGLGPECGSK